MYKIDGNIRPENKRLTKHTLGTAVLVYDFLRRGLHPSLGRLAKHRGVSLRTLKDHLKVLRGLGLECEPIITDGGQRLGTRYSWPAFDELLNINKRG